MTAQHQTDELPRIASRHHRYDRDYIIEDKRFDLTELLWPVASWFIVLTNASICAIAVYDMYKTGYVWYYHFTLTIAFCLTLAALAIIHKKYNNSIKENDGV